MATDTKALKEQTTLLVGFFQVGQYYDLAELLTELRHTGIHELHGCKTFWEYTDKAEIGGQRAARYLINTFVKLKKLGYTEVEMRGLFETFGWSVLKDIAKHLRKRIAPRTLKKEYGGLTNAALRGKLKGAEKVQFTATIPKAQHDKLIRLLKKKYGLVKKGKGEGNVAEAFGKMIDAAAKKRG